MALLVLLLALRLLVLLLLVRSLLVLVLLVVRYARAAEHQRLLQPHPPRLLPRQPLLLGLLVRKQRWSLAPQYLPLA